MLQMEQQGLVSQLVNSRSSEGRDRILGKLEFIQQWVSGSMRDHYTALAEQVLDPPGDDPEGANGAAGSTPWMETTGDV